MLIEPVRVTQENYEAVLRQISRSPSTESEICSELNVYAEELKSLVRRYASTANPEPAGETGEKPGGVSPVTSETGITPEASSIPTASGFVDTVFNEQQGFKMAEWY